MHQYLNLGLRSKKILHLVDLGVEVADVGGYLDKLTGLKYNAAVLLGVPRGDCIHNSKGKGGGRVLGPRGPTQCRVLRFHHRDTSQDPYNNIAGECGFPDG